jgi:chromosome segregation ATPase
LKARHNDEVDDLRQQHAKEIDESSQRIEQLTRDWEIERESMRNESDTLSSRSRQLLQRKEEQHNSTVSKLTQKHTFESEQMKKKHSAELSRQKQTHATELNKLKQKHGAEQNKVEKEMEEIQSRSSQKEKEYSARTGDLDDQISGLMATCQSTMNDLDKASDELSTAKQTIQELRVQICDLELKLTGVKDNESVLSAELKVVSIESEKRERELIDAKNEIVMLQNELKVYHFSI